MGGSYRQCGECGKRALSIATRCPGCGREFPPAPPPEVGAIAKVGRSISPAAAGLVAVAVLLLAMEVGSSGRPTDAPASAAESPGPGAESEVAYAMGATARLDTASVEGTPDIPPAGILVAKTWTNVRKARSRRADLEAILSPGDSVLADSLDLGWYRVSFMGEVLGYAHSSTLETPKTQ